MARKTKRASIPKVGKLVTGTTRHARTSRGRPSDREHVHRESGSILGDRMERLQAEFPEIFVEGKVDLDRLRDTLGDFADSGPERYTFSWAGKRDAISLLQMSSRAALVPIPKESADFEKTDNLFIEGENLEVLKLLYKSYFGRVKMIYIDPPYNTGSDLVYRDSYTDPLNTYLAMTGQKDDSGNILTSNPETSGRYHSAWLSMMYPRLFIARQLLREDGVIFVSIDDHEVHNLRMLMNEVFGEECFKNCIIFRRGIKSVQAQFDTVDALTVGHEYVVMYAKSPNARFRKLQIARGEAKDGTWNNHWRGTNRPTMRYELFGKTPTEGQWRWSKERSLRAIDNYQRMLKELGATEEAVTQEQIDQWYLQEIERMDEEIDLLRLSPTGKPEHYVPPTETKLGSDLWTDLSPRGSAELTALFGRKVFDNPKPVGLVTRMLEFATDPEGADIVLDFFAGSCTTAHAVLELNREDDGNRRFIMVQLPEPTPEDSPARKAGFKTIAEIGKERIRRVIARMQSRQLEDPTRKREIALKILGFRIFRLADSSFKLWRGIENKDVDEYTKQMEFFADSLVDGWKATNVLWEVAVKEGYPLTSRVEKLAGAKSNALYRVIDEEKKQSFLISLNDKVDGEVLAGLGLGKHDLFVCRDSALDDSAAANLALQCRMKTI